MAEKAEKKKPPVLVNLHDHLHSSIATPGGTSMVRLDRMGVARRIYTNDSPTIRVETKRPRIGGRNWFISSPGIYVLATEEGSFRSLACTNANQGFAEVLDWDGSVETIKKSRPILQMAPPILGQWPLDANFSMGLVVRIGGGHTCPFLTVVWFLASDIGNGK